MFCSKIEPENNPKRKKCNFFQKNYFSRISIVIFTISFCLYAETLKAKGDIYIDFSTYRPNSTMNGSLYLYLKNDSKHLIGIKDIKINNYPITEFVKNKTVSWFRMSPQLIPGGEMGELLIRFRCLPSKILRKIFFSVNTQQEALDIKLILTNGEILNKQIFISEKKEPMQINFIAFSKDLKKVYVYLQNNLRQQKPSQTFNISKIFMNGTDYTDKAVFGQKKLTDTVIPVTIPLDKALSKGKPVVVTVYTKEGMKTGHTLRAIPSEFFIQACLYAPMLRHDAIRDLYNHGITCIASQKDRWLSRAVKMGFSAFSYGREKTLKILKHFNHKKYPVTGMWLDELDDNPIKASVKLINEIKDYYKSIAKPMPLCTVNICGVRTLRGTNFFELADAITHEYGLDGLGGGGFAEYASLPKREYRLSRRPFIPYLRNHEIGLEVVDNSTRIVGISKKRPYIIEPREERWLTYGCLMQGAKGIMHWGYGVAKYKFPNWFSQKYPVIRIGMGGVPGNMAYGYKIPDYIVNDLRATWDEVGRINAELLTIGEKVAISDISNLAKISRVISRKNVKNKEKAAEVATLICGNDTIIVLLLNMNMDTTWNPRRQHGEGIQLYDPVDVTVDLTVPAWLKPKDIFTVSYNGISSVAARRKEGKINFRFPKLKVSKIIIVTSDNSLRSKMSKKLNDMQKRLKKIRLDKPEPIRGRCKGIKHANKYVNAEKAGGVVYVSDLIPISAKQGWGKLQLDQSVDKNQLMIGNIVFEKGLGTHAKSEIVYQIKGKYERLEGFAGIDREVLTANGNATFEVYLDNKKSFSSYLSAKMPAKKISLDVTGVNELKLVVGDGKNIEGSKHADWADLKLLTRKAASRLTPGKNKRWKISDEKAIDLRNAKQASMHYCLSRCKLQNGTMEVSVTPTGKHAINDVGGYGFIKYLDRGNFIAFRFGAYGSNNVYILQNGKSTFLHTKHKFKPKVGKEYRLKVVLSDDTATFYINNKESGRLVGLPFQKRNGVAGICSMGLAEFRNWSFSKLESCSSIDTPEKQAMEYPGISFMGLVAEVRGGPFQNSLHCSVGVPNKKTKWTWQALSGNWKFDGDKCQNFRSNNRESICLAVSNQRISRGIVELEFTPTKNKMYGVGGYGPVKFIDARNYIAIRYGVYKSISVYIMENGKKRIHYTGYNTKQKVGEKYRAKVFFNHNRIMISYNDKIITIIDNLPFGKTEGYLGLFALGACDFNNLKIKTTR